MAGPFAATDPRSKAPESLKVRTTNVWSCVMGLRVWQLLRGLLLEHDNEADDAKAEVGRTGRRVVRHVP
jgi:hypothetical protein